MSRVLAAMSGGVDSAVAAALLAERGEQVTGVTLRLACYGHAPLGPRACCTLEAIDDARRAAQAMGFPHHVLDAEDVFRRRVLQPFADGYAAGRTPYPCALCNLHLKFGDLIGQLEAAGADWLATGHYARLERDARGELALRRAADADKDQTYALALVPYAALARARFPLGDLGKAEVRAHARRLGLACWDKPESQDLCFVPDGDYAGHLTGALGETRGTAPGAFVDGLGARVGTHRGVLHYTVGQRRGLGLAGRERWYVLAIDAAANTVTVGPRAALARAGLVTAPANWLLPAPPVDGTRARVQVRYRHAGAPATLHPQPDGRVRVRFETPQGPVAPGQLAVFYAGARCLGGGTIEAALAADGAPATAGHAA
ncbi:MAG TPA: tRNA 2-thiouridine(34) synthase MnmA [Candidatus Eisenbacteria bacterium]|nr:tRNA 2-thiouridine(34) synthase MnmA [Candidatus Eisenbacteria bacterium]